MIIFLDIDGVIATVESYETNEDLLDTKAINILNELTDDTNAEIVISSTWRIEGLANLQNKLYRNGVKAKIIDVTPRINNKTILSTQRGHEILEWIKVNNYTGNYIVIDDEVADILSCISKDKVIHVEKGWFGPGLTKEHIKKYIKEKYDERF